MSENPKSDPRDYVVDISSLKKESDTPADKDAAARVDDTLSIYFKCCNVYAKIRLTRDAKAFAGHCPRCAAAVRVEIDPNSTNTGRFFTAG